MDIKNHYMKYALLYQELEAMHEEMIEEMQGCWNQIENFNLSGKLNETAITIIRDKLELLTKHAFSIERILHNDAFEIMAHLEREYNKTNTP